MRLRFSLLPMGMHCARLTRLLPIGPPSISTRPMSAIQWLPLKKEKSILKEIISRLAPTSTRARYGSWDSSRNHCSRANWQTSTRCAPIRTSQRHWRAICDHNNNIIHHHCNTLKPCSILLYYPT